VIGTKRAEGGVDHRWFGEGGLLLHKKQRKKKKNSCIPKRGVKTGVGLVAADEGSWDAFLRKGQGTLSQVFAGGNPERGQGFGEKGIMYRLEKTGIKCYSM